MDFAKNGPIIVALATVLLLIVILVVGAARRSEEDLEAAPVTDFSRAPRKCTVRFYQPSAGVYCVKDGGRDPVCANLPIPAIIRANETAGMERCSEIEWGFGCDPGILCALQESGANLISEGTAQKIRAEMCGQTAPLVCGYL